MRFGLIMTGMRVSQSSSNDCYKLLDDGADWLKSGANSLLLKSNSITMKTEDHGKKKKKHNSREGDTPTQPKSEMECVAPAARS